MIKLSITLQENEICDKEDCKYKGRGMDKCFGLKEERNTKFICELYYKDLEKEINNVEKNSRV